MLLVFDIGATHSRIGLAHDGQLQQTVRINTDPRRAGFDLFVEQAKAVAQGQNLTAVAGGMPGQFKGTEGQFELSPNLPEWNGIRALSKLQQAFACPVYLANDVVLGGLGECHYGAGTTEGIMVYVTVSTGINAVRLVDGAVDPTIARYELGRHVVEGQHGRVTNLEALVGGAALQKRYGRPPREIRDERVWRAEERHLAHGLYNLVLDWAPEVIVFGGSMMRDINLRNLGAEMHRLPQVTSEWPRLKRAKLGDAVGLYGALTYARQQAQK